jgi:hypothetical protein
MSLKRSREGAPAQQLGGLRPLVDQILQQASDFFDQLRGSIPSRPRVDRDFFDAQVVLDAETASAWAGGQTATPCAHRRSAGHAGPGSALVGRESWLSSLSLEWMSRACRAVVFAGFPSAPVVFQA